MDPKHYPKLCPDTMTFNTMLLRASRRQDKSGARKILALMNERNIQHDAFTLGAIGQLLTPPAPTVAFTNNNSGAAVAEAEVDAWMARLRKSHGTITARLEPAASYPFNQVKSQLDSQVSRLICCVTVYCRLCKPTFALAHR